MINTVWFVLLSAMLTGYAVLDGFDLGVGALHLVLGRSARERASSIDAIGPVWNGNEVWLLAAGGSMVVAFPHVYASAFSGFYLALMLVVWLLLLRGVSIEFRHQVDHAMWHDFWDVVLSAASALLALLFGVAVANVLRGVPLDAGGEFVGTFALLLNPFALLGGGLGLGVLCLHGATWLAHKTTGPVQARARCAVPPLWGCAILLLAAMVVTSFFVRPGFEANFARWPALLAIPALGIVAAVEILRRSRRGDDRGAFLGTSALIVSVLGSAAAGLYPRLLPSLPGGPHHWLDIYNAASAPRSLWIALGVYLFGMVLVVTYLVNVYRIWRGKVGETAIYH